MTGRLDWFTSCVRDGGEQEVHIRPPESTAAREIVHLDLSQSQLLIGILYELANDLALDWAPARQAVPRAFYKAGLPAAR